MTSENLLEILREHVADDSPTCIILPTWTKGMLTSDEVDGVPVYYSDNVQPESERVH